MTACSSRLQKDQLFIQCWKYFFDICKEFLGVRQPAPTSKKLAQKWKVIFLYICMQKVGIKKTVAIDLLGVCSLLSFGVYFMDNHVSSILLHD